MALNRLNRPMTYATRLLAFLLALFLLPACSYHHGVGKKGTVLDKQTGQPIPDVYVIGQWEGTQWYPVEGKWHCVHVEQAMTNDKGEFHIPSWIKKIDLPLLRLNDREPAVYIYKPGFEKGDRKQISDPYYLVSFTGSNRDRFAYLKRLHSGIRCGSAGESEKNTLPMLRALYSEAQKIVEQNQNKGASEYEELADTILYTIKQIEQGSDEAQKRSPEWREGER